MRDHAAAGQSARPRIGLAKIGDRPGRAFAGRRRGVAPAREPQLGNITTAGSNCGHARQSRAGDEAAANTASYITARSAFSAVREAPSR